MSRSPGETKIILFFFLLPFANFDIQILLTPIIYGYMLLDMEDPL